MEGQGNYRGGGELGDYGRWRDRETRGGGE